MSEEKLEGTDAPWVDHTHEDDEPCARWDATAGGPTDTDDAMQNAVQWLADMLAAVDENTVIDAIDKFYDDTSRSAEDTLKGLRDARVHLDENILNLSEEVE